MKKVIYTVIISVSVLLMSCSDFLNSFENAVAFKQNKLSASAASELSGYDHADDQFGFSVAMSDEFIVIGAPQYDDFKGAVYIFRYNGTSWDFFEKIRAIDYIDDEPRRFGYSVAIEGSYIVVGAKSDTLWGASGSGSAYAYIWDGSTWDSVKNKIVPSNEIDGGEFGHSVAISGDYIVIGSYGADNILGGGINHGSAYIYKILGIVWGIQEPPLPAAPIKYVQNYILSDSNIESQQALGCSVAIDGEHILIGAQEKKTAEPNKYFYAYNWDGSQFGVTAIAPPNPTSHDDYGMEYRDPNYYVTLTGATNSFGRAISIDGNYAAVSDSEDGAGKVYIFEVDGSGVWTKKTSITPNDGESGDNFGSSVSLKGDWLIVGAQDNDTQGTDSGAAYIFKRDGSQWEQYVKITTTDGLQKDRLGNAVSISGENFLVGSYLDDDLGEDCGSAYTFKKTDFK